MSRSSSSTPLPGGRGGAGRRGGVGEVGERQRAALELGCHPGETENQSMHTIASLDVGHHAATLPPAAGRHAAAAATAAAQPPVPSTHVRPPARTSWSAAPAPACRRRLASSAAAPPRPRRPQRRHRLGSPLQTQERRHSGREAGGRGAHRKELRRRCGSCQQRNRLISCTCRHVRQLWLQNIVQHALASSLPPAGCAAVTPRPAAGPHRSCRPPAGRARPSSRQAGPREGRRCLAARLPSDAPAEGARRHDQSTAGSS